MLRNAANLARGAGHYIHRAFSGIRPGNCFLVSAVAGDISIARI